MLSNAINKGLIQNELMNIYKNVYARVEQSGGCKDVFTSLKGLCGMSPNLYNEYYGKAYLLFNQAGALTQENATNYDIITFYGMAMSGRFMVLTPRTGKAELFTSSLTELNALHKEGRLVKRDGTLADMETFYKKFYIAEGTIDKGMAKSLNENDTFFAVKLEPKFSNGCMKYIASMPRPTRKLSESVIVPIVELTCGVNCIRELAKKHLLTAKVSRPDGSIDERYITLNPNILSQYYDTDRVNDLLRRSTKFDVNLNKNYLPSVGASIHSEGISNISPFALEGIAICQKPNIDRTLLNFDYSVVPQVFMDALGKLSQEQLSVIQQAFKVNPEAQTRFQVESEIKQTILTVRNTNLFKFMQQHPDMFDMNTLLQTKKTYIKGMKRVDIPKTTQELRDLLNQSICRVRIKRTNGSSMVRDITNSKTKLQEVYGSNYVAEFESENTKRKYLVYLLNKHTGEMNAQVLKSYCVGAGLPEIYNELAEYALDDGTISAEAYEVEKDNFTYQIKQGITEKANKGDFGAVTARYVDLVKGHNDSIKQTFYLSVILNNIEEIAVIG